VPIHVVLMRYVVLIAISRKFNVNTILYFDFHQACVMVIYVIFTSKGFKFHIVVICYVLLCCREY
jgi:hypothetical protein